MQGPIDSSINFVLSCVIPYLTIVVNVHGVPIFPAENGDGGSPKFMTPVLHNHTPELCNTSYKLLGVGTTLYSYIQSVNFERVAQSSSRLAWRCT